MEGKFFTVHRLQKEGRTAHAPPLSRVAALTFLFFSLLCLVLYQWDNKYTAYGTQPINGVLCLTEEDLAAVPLRYLIEDWEFYPGVLLTPENFSNGGQDQYHRYISIGEYGGMELYSPGAAVQGCGTYRMVLSLPESSLTYSLKIPVIYSAYRLYIGSDLFLQMGSMDPAQHQETLREQVISFRGRGYVQLLLTICDQPGFYSGITEPPTFGLPLSVSAVVSGSQLLSCIIGLIALMLLVLSIYLACSAQRKLNGYLILLCLFLLGYLFFPLSRFILSLPNLPWKLLETFFFYGFYTTLTWTCCAYYGWIGWTAQALKLTSLFLTSAFLLTGGVPLLSQIQSSDSNTTISAILQWILLLHTALLTIKSIRENNSGTYGLFFTVGGVELCVCMAAALMLPPFAPILSAWFPEVGLMSYVVVLSLAEWSEFSNAYHFRLTYSERFRQVEHLLAFQEAHYIRLSEKIKETTRMRHDLRQHLRLIRSMLNRGQTEELSRYLDQYEQSEQHSFSQPLQFCEVQVVDAILSYYCDKSMALGASFEFSGQIPLLPSTMHVDFCTMLGNLLENCLDAIKQQSDGPRFLRVKADLLQNKLLLQVSNSFSTPVRQQQQRLYSTKRDEPGIGTLSVQIIAERYGGFADFSSHDQEFTARVVLSVRACHPSTQSQTPGV